MVRSVDGENRKQTQINAQESKAKVGGRRWSIKRLIGDRRLKSVMSHLEKLEHGEGTRSGRVKLLKPTEDYGTIRALYREVVQQKRKSLGWRVRQFFGRLWPGKKTKGNLLEGVIVDVKQERLAAFDRILKNIKPLASDSGEDIDVGSDSESAEQVSEPVDYAAFKSESLVDRIVVYPDDGSQNFQVRLRRDQINTSLAGRVRIALHVFKRYKSAPKQLSVVRDYFHAYRDALIENFGASGIKNLPSATLNRLDRRLAELDAGLEQFEKLPDIGLDLAPLKAERNQLTVEVARRRADALAVLAGGEAEIGTAANVALREQLASSRVSMEAKREIVTALKGRLDGLDEKAAEDPSAVIDAVRNSKHILAATKDPALLEIVKPTIDQLLAKATEQPVKECREWTVKLADLMQAAREQRSPNQLVALRNHVTAGHLYHMDNQVLMGHVAEATRLKMPETQARALLEELNLEYQVLELVEGQNAEAVDGSKALTAILELAEDLKKLNAEYDRFSLTTQEELADEIVATKQDVAAAREALEKASTDLDEVTKQNRELTAEQAQKAARLPEAEQRLFKLGEDLPLLQQLSAIAAQPFGSLQITPEQDALLRKHHGLFKRPVSAWKRTKVRALLAEADQRTSAQLKADKVRLEQRIRQAQAEGEDHTELDEQLTHVRLLHIMSSPRGLRTVFDQIANAQLPAGGAAMLKELDLPDLFEMSFVESRKVVSKLTARVAELTQEQSELSVEVPLLQERLAELEQLTQESMWKVTAATVERSAKKESLDQAEEDLASLQQLQAGEAAFDAAKVTLLTDGKPEELQVLARDVGKEMAERLQLDLHSAALDTGDQAMPSELGAFLDDPDNPPARDDLVSAYLKQAVKRYPTLLRLERLRNEDLGFLTDLPDLRLIVSSEISLVLGRSMTM